MSNARELSQLATATTGFKNRLINSQGLINQRGYVSGTATTGANQYTVDRWRVVTSGQNLSWTTSGNVATFTAPAGGVEQVIEGLNLETGTYVLSWTGTATATVGGVSVSNGGSVSVTGGTNTTIRFSSGTFSIPQFEKGTVRTEFDYRPFQSEVVFCQRYYTKSYSLSEAPGTARSVGMASIGNGSGNGFTSGYTSVIFPVRMRTAPTVVSYDCAGTANKFSYYNAAWYNGGGATYQGVTDSAALIVSNGSIYYTNFEYTASAEL
jgi:hypothetical protein